MKINYQGYGLINLVLVFLRSWPWHLNKKLWNLKKTGTENNPLPEQTFLSGLITYVKKTQPQTIRALTDLAHPKWMPSHWSIQWVTDITGLTRKTVYQITSQHNKAWMNIEIGSFIKIVKLGDESCFFIFNAKTKHHLKYLKSLSPWIYKSKYKKYNLGNQSWILDQDNVLA